MMNRVWIGIAIVALVAVGVGGCAENQGAQIANTTSHQSESAVGGLYPRDGQVYLDMMYTAFEAQLSETDPAFPLEFGELPVYAGDFEDVTTFVYVAPNFTPGSLEGAQAYELDVEQALVDALLGTYELTSGPATLQASLSPVLLAETVDGSWYRVLAPAQGASRRVAPEVAASIANAMHEPFASGDLRA